MVYGVLVRAGLARAGMGWAGLGWAGLGWAGLGWAGLGWAGLGWAGRCWLLWGHLGWAGLSRKRRCGQRIFKRQWYMTSFRVRCRVVGASTKTTAAAKAFSSASGIWRPLAGDAFPRKRAPSFEETLPLGLVVSKRQWKEERARGLLRALL